MTPERIFQVVGSIITLATITTVLSSPQTANVIRESANALSSNVRVAMGRG